MVLQQVLDTLEAMFLYSGDVQFSSVTVHYIAFLCT
jgi:hypothetical protein